MNSLLIILGVLGIGTVLVSAHVFVVAARVYVSEDHPASAGRAWIERSRRDRRRRGNTRFPLNIDGLLIEADRRLAGDRRQQLPS